MVQPRIWRSSILWILARGATCTTSSTRTKGIGKSDPNTQHLVNGVLFSIDATTESGRYGWLVNHSSKSPNLLTKVVMVNEVPRLILVAKHAISPGEEILYDYGDRSKKSLRDFPWLSNMGQKMFVKITPK